MTEEREGVWAELGIGAIMRDARGESWEVVGAAVPTQFEYAKTCWLKVRNAAGEEYALEPRHVLKKVTILREATERAWPDGAREAALLAEQLGALEICTRDEVSGEIWCPADEWGVEAELLHLRVAHGLDTVGIDDITTRISAHGKAHDAAYPHFGKAGFPHRHVPEDPNLIR